jgi:HD-GYP domain-containing protein (c-di-GMP phosphodiesterase class II)
MPITDLRIGMFVSKPDCGWRNTSFMLEGMLVQNVEEIATLAKFAKQVIVDPRRSHLKSFDNKYQNRIYEEIPKTGNISKEGKPDLAGNRNSQQLRTQKKNYIDWRSLIGKTGPTRDSDSTRDMDVRRDASISRIIAAEHDVSFRNYIFSVYGPQTAEMKADGLFQAFSARLLGLVRSSGIKARQTKKARPAPPASKPSYIPADVQLVIYPDPEPTYVALPKAREACEHVEKTLKRIVDDISVRGISNVETLREAADTVVDNVIARPDTMMWISKMRAYSDVRYHQALSVAIHLTALGRHIGFQRAQLADLAGIGLLLDMGKVTIDATLLNKPGRLSQFEIEIVRTHVQQGLKMFGESGNLPAIMTRAIAEHHERVDGSGYPNNLSGKDISIYGKMAAIADSFVAMVNPRPYAPTYAAYDAIRQLFRESDSRWFRPLVEQFVQSIGIFPVGSLIELSTGEVAIVVQHNRIRRMEPKVLVVTSREKAVLDRPWDLDILRHNQNATSTEIRILKGVADGAYGIDFRKYYLNMK